MNEFIDGVSPFTGIPCRIFKDQVEFLVEHEKELPKIVDDVAIGIMLGHLHIHPAPRLDIPTIELAKRVDISSHFHFRCKSIYSLENRLDGEIMEIMHRRINNE